MLVVFQVGALLGSSIDPRLLSLQGIDLSRIEWTPFEVLWRQPMPEAAADIPSTLVICGVLATRLLPVLRRAHIAPA